MADYFERWLYYGWVEGKPNPPEIPDMGSTGRINQVANYFSVPPAQVGWAFVERYYKEVIQKKGVIFDMARPLV